MSGGERLQVVAAVVERGGAVLVARRATGARAGRWEFPGGKVEAGEAHDAALARELDEELGLALRVGAHLCTVRHRYPDLEVELHVYRCVAAGESTPRLRSGDHDALRWLSPEGLGALDLCEADREVAAALRDAGAGPRADGNVAPVTSEVGSL